MVKYLVLLFIIAVVLISITQLPITNNQLPINNQITNYKIQSTPTSTPTVIKNFPFTVQAPLGEWENPIFQDGCEEATTLMVECSLLRFNEASQGRQCPVTDGVIDKNWAREEIIKMSEGPVDTSAEDTAKKFLTNIKYQIINFTNMEDLKSGVWIVPMNGQKLGNPHYKAPGPERHMILVIGYDAKTDELITNDPGTKHGKGYRYKLETFWQAVRDYPTGEHKKIVGVEKRGIRLY